MGVTVGVAMEGVVAGVVAVVAGVVAPAMGLRTMVTNPLKVPHTAGHTRNHPIQVFIMAPPPWQHPPVHRPATPHRLTEGGPCRRSVWVYCI